MKIYEGAPLVSNKHSLSDTGMKTDLLKRPEITFMKINFISQHEPLALNVLDTRIFPRSRLALFDVDWFWIHESWQGIINILTKTQPWVKCSAQRPKLAQILRSQKPAWSNLVAVQNQQRCQFVSLPKYFLIKPYLLWRALVDVKVAENFKDFAKRLSFA